MSLDDRVERIETKVDEIATACSSMAPKVARADKELWGNGRPGLAVQMAQVQSTQKLALKVLGTVGGIIATGVVGILIKMLSG